jgi:restriction system-associated AAA family ATPase
MKLLRLKITDTAGFRSLQHGFEHHFRTEWAQEEEMASSGGFAPFVCAGPNGSGKSNLLEVLAAIFYQLEVLRMRRNFLPEVLATLEDMGAPRAFELEYRIMLPAALLAENATLREASVKVTKVAEKSPTIVWSNVDDFPELSKDMQSGGFAGDREREFLLPEYVLGYSSGENEILSLPFFKMRFTQFDEYWNALTQQQSYPGRPATRLAYLDNSFSQAILLCNLLFQDEATLAPFREEVGIVALKEFRIILRRSIPIGIEQLAAFASEDQNKSQSTEEIVAQNPALTSEMDENGRTSYRVNLIELLEGDERSSLMVSALTRCATLSYVDEATDTLILDYRVNDATIDAFRDNFDNSPLALFQVFQVLLTLNLYSVSDALKSDLYRSNSLYVSETVPSLASDERVMRFKFVHFSRQGVGQQMMLKDLSDGEHQLLHSLGLCLLFRGTNCVFLLDEPETHFNPHWRANFISRLRQCLPKDASVGQEMLITTHTPFLISDSKADKVLVFKKTLESGEVSISQPDYNTLGASINKITMNTFEKRETIGGHAQAVLESLRARFEQGGEDNSALIEEIHQKLGDSVEKVMLVKTILDSEQQGDRGAQN